MSALRWSHRALREGDIEHGWLLDDDRGLYGYRRVAGAAEAVVVLNRGDSDVELELDLVDPFGEGRVVGPGEARVFATPGDTIAVPEVWREGGTLRWTPVFEDTDGGREVALAYEVLVAGEVFARVEPPRFGGPLALEVEAEDVAVRAVGVWGPGGAKALGGVQPEPDAAVSDAAVSDAAVPPPQDAGRIAAPDSGSQISATASDGCGQVPVGWSWPFLLAIRRRWRGRSTVR
jgi:hypothetical protein